MSFRFDYEKAQHIILFLVHSLGGSSDIPRLFLLLYLADLKHLARHGSLILGDSYVAMKYGPAPFNVFGMSRQLESEDNKANRKINLHFDKTGRVVAKAPYKAAHLASSEVECLFEVISQYKDCTLDLLSEVAKDKAWNSANINGGIGLMDMVMASGATTDMISYIESSYSDELNSFNQQYET